MTDFGFGTSRCYACSRFGYRSNMILEHGKWYHPSHLPRKNSVITLPLDAKNTIEKDDFQKFWTV